MRQSARWWCCTLGGKATRRSQDKEQAEEEIHAKARDAEEGGPRPTFRRMADDFLEYFQGENPKKAFETHCDLLQSSYDRIKAGGHVTSGQIICATG
jgi:hypothetical protein